MVDGLQRCFQPSRNPAPNGGTMQILPIVMTTAIAALHTPATAGRITSSDSLLVTAVLDGRTIAVARLGHVRLLGIEAPETGRGFGTAPPFAREARDRLSELILRRWVHLETDGAPLNTYKRRLAYVIRDDGMFVNATLIREGLARVTARVPLRRLDELKRAEGEAQRARRGIWGSAPPLPAAATRYTPKLPARSLDFVRGSPERSRSERSRASKMRQRRKPVAPPGHSQRTRSH
jgi:micrococcal nuclease